MTTTRPILGAEGTPSQPQPQPQPQQTPVAAEQPLAKGLPPWDLMPSDLLLVRRRSVKKS